MALRRRTPYARVVASLIAAAVVAGCGGSTSETTAAAPVRVAGLWVSSGATLPVMSLDLGQTGESLTAIVRLSGVELAGTGTVSGSRVTIAVTRPGSTDQFLLSGTIESESQMSVRFAAPPGGDVTLVLNRQ
jgi:hypothetical protein